MALIDIVKYDAPDDTSFVWKYPSEDLKIGTQVVVNQGQEVIFVKSGQALDLLEPGTHTLSTGNIPFLNKLINLPFGGDTPFTAELWYINKTVKRDLKWGTPSPIQIMDNTLGFPVSARSFGKWGTKIENSRSFVTQIVGSQLTADDKKISDYFIGEIIQKLSSIIATAININKISILQITSSLNELSKFASELIKKEFERYGLDVVNFNIESINIPEEDRVPACVSACPASARHFGNFADPNSEVSILTAERGGFDLMPEQDCKPVNKYLPPRTRDSYNSSQEGTYVLEDAAPEGGFLGWVDKLLSD